MTADFLCTNNLFKRGTWPRRQVRESGFEVCWSKTVFSRKVEKKDRMRVAENPIKTPQAKARCGVSDRKI